MSRASVEYGRQASGSDFAIVSPGFRSGPQPTPLPPVQTNDIFQGTSGDDTFTGTSGADVFNVAQAGHDSIHGGGGDDEIHFGRFFGPNDVVRGDAGRDTLFLSGDAYAGGLTITQAMLSGVEEIELAGGNSYDFTLGLGALHNASGMIVLGTALSSGQHLTVDASAIANTIVLEGGNGSDVLTGGSGDDTIRSSPSATNGGNDTLSGGDGEDFIVMQGDLNNGDRIRGGAGSDILNLTGNYAAGLALQGDTLQGIEAVSLNGAFGYNLTTADGNIAAGVEVKIDATQVTGNHAVIFDGSAETDGRFFFVGSAGDDQFSGGAKGDFFLVETGGSDTLTGGGGNDEFGFIANALDQSDHIFGGNGHDVVRANSFATSHLTLNAALMTSIEEFDFQAGSLEHFTTTDNLVGAGKTFTLDAQTASAGGKVDFDGAAETNGKFVFFGSDGADSFVAGSGDDFILARAGADQLTGGGGHDTYYYSGPDDSWGRDNHDTITGFDAHQDVFQFPDLHGVTGIDAEVDGGTLTNAHFESDLVNALDGHLDAQHAIIFKPDSGSYAGKTLLVIDQNFQDGYQNELDAVIVLSNPLHLADLDLTNF